MSHSRSSAAVYGGAEKDEEPQQRFAHLDLIFCSSEDDRAPAQNLQTRYTLPHQHQEQDTIDNSTQDDCCLPVVLHGGWESEKFCEYPQELVFRVNRGIPTQVDSLHLLSHHLKIASRVEIFTSTSTPSRQMQQHAWRGGEFQRLGFVSFRSNEATDIAARELKIVHLQNHRKKITLVRLVLHRCHANQHNLFQQVGLLSVVASTQKSLPSNVSWSPLTSGLLPSLHPSRAAEEQQQLGACGESTGHLFSSSLSPLRAKYATNLVAPEGKSPVKKVASAPTLLLLNRRTPVESNDATGEYDVWIPELHEFRTPLQIATRVELCRELASQSGGNASRTAQSWRSLDLEGRHLLNKLDILQRTFDDMSHLIAVDDRIAMHEEIDRLVQDFGALGSKVFASELELLEQGSEAAPSQVNGPEVSLSQIFPTLKRGLATENWQTREELVWEVVEHLRKVSTDDDKAKSRVSSPTTATEDEEALTIATQVLRDDTHSQVFIAGCSLLQLVLTRSHPLQEPASLRNHVRAPRMRSRFCVSFLLVTALIRLLWCLLEQLAEVLDVLLQRLDDRQAVIRNNAAFSILKLAELSRAKGTFVMHVILKKLEGSKQQFRVTDQVLHAVLKLFIALLQSFHCCASIDIAPRRILRFLLMSDAAMHANPHIRDAAKQLTLAMYNEVGSEVMVSYLSKLPVEVQEMYQLQFTLSDEKKKAKIFHNE